MKYKVTTGTKSHNGHGENCVVFVVPLFVVFVTLHLLSVLAVAHTQSQVDKVGLITNNVCQETQARRQLH
jgi:hypothetical protein